MEEFLEEYEYANNTFQCKTAPSILLCTKIRLYSNDIGKNPTIYDVICHDYTPCEDSCHYKIPVDETIQIQVHSIIEYGTLIMSCKRVYVLYNFYLLKGRYPTIQDNIDEIGFDEIGLDELILIQSYAQSTQMMHEYTDQLWDTRQSGVSSEHMKSSPLESTLTDQCVFCQESFQTQQHVLRLPCSHMFHDTEECNGVRLWLTKINACPLCKCKCI